MVKCKDVCLRYRAKKGQGSTRYANGQKRCQICEIFIQWEGFGAHVAATGSEPCPETGPTRRNSGRQRRVITVKVPYNGMVGCKEICERYKAKRRGLGSVRYSIGQKRCQMCDIYLEWEGLYCPCCGFKLRTRPRNAKFRQKLREMIASRQEIKNDDG